MSNSVEFVDIALDNNQKKQMRAWAEKLPPEFDPIAEFLSQNYAVKVTWDARNQCFAVFVMPLSKDDYNYGCILTARSDAWHKAVIVAYWKHEILKKRRWFVAPRERAQSNEWDL